MTEEFASVNLKGDAYSRWNACRSSMRFMSFINKELIVFRILFGRAQVLDTLRCLSVALDPNDGLVSTWASKDKLHTVRYTPVEIHEGCFLFHIRNSNIEYEEYKGRFSAKFSMRYRTYLNPQSRVEGAVYVLEKAVFNTTFGA